MDPAREWTSFVGGSLLLMGASLVAAAARRAQDAVAWESERRRLSGAEPLAEEGAAFRRLQTTINRVSGAVVGTAGAAALLGAARGRFWGRGPSGAAGLVFGAGLLLAALVGAVARAWTRGTRPRFLKDEPAPARPPGEAAAELCTWTLRALWIAYGARLLTTLRF